MKHPMTVGQQQALDAILDWLSSKQQQCYVLEGFAGTGKTYLVEQLMERVEQYNEVLHALHLPTWDPVLTATTNAAVDVLQHSVKTPANTIHRVMGLIVRTCYKTDKTFITRKKGAIDPVHCLIVVDEASYIDRPLLDKILLAGKKAKFLFIGDPCQLPPVGSSEPVVFNSNYPTSKLTEVVRQDSNNPVYQLSLGLREHVLGSDVPDLDLIDGSLEQVDGDTFKRLMIQEFNRPDWKYTDSKYVSWTNKSAIGANNFLLNIIKGRSGIVEGDMLSNNHTVPSLKTGEMVRITDVQPVNLYNVSGNSVVINREVYFVPDDPSDIDKSAAEALKEDNPIKLKLIRESWLDLREVYACTVNKAQGASYNTVFIDMSNLALCKDPNLKARLLYVAVSRAKQRVVLTGAY
jgi:hypothetical protein